MKLKISSKTWVSAIRQGLVSIIPILMIGAFALVLRSLPIKPYQSFIASWFGGTVFRLVDSVYNITFNMLSPFMAVSIGYHYAVLKTGGTDGCQLACPLVSLACFILLTGVGSLTTDTMGAKGMFLAMVSALGASSVFICFKNRLRPVQLMADGADVHLSNAVGMIIPMAVTVAICAVVNHALLRIFAVSTVHDLFLNGANALFSLTNNRIVNGLLYVLLSSVMWFFGIHGSDVLEGVSQTLFVSASNVNSILVAAGEEPTQILTKPFFDVFVLMGGCGCAMCLLIAILLFSKRSSNRGLAKMSALPMLFNINEIMVFGLPIIYNPTMLVPFLTVPLVCFITAYFSMWSGLVPLVSSPVEWTTPVFIGGYVATGSISGSILQLVNICIGVAIYRPFVKKYDNEKLVTAKADYEHLVSVMQLSEAERHPVTLTRLPGSDGTIAKALAADLGKAFQNGELTLYYQPQYRLDGSCLGAEALLRWNHSMYGMVYPPLILQLADEADLLEELEQFIVKKAIEDAHTLYNENGMSLKISVNVTGVSIQKQVFEDFLLQQAKAISPGVCICLELTEQTALKFDSDLQSRFARLHDAGYKLAIDDFSMGNTSLQYLQGSYFNMVKLDGSLVKSSRDNPRCIEIISSIVQLSKTLGFDVLAEYVSSVQLRDAMAGIGCTMYQGWLYSPAITLEEYRKRMLEEKNKM